MSIIFNNTNVENVVFNGTELDKVIMDGVTVFEKSKEPVEITETITVPIIFFGSHSDAYSYITSGVFLPVTLNHIPISGTIVVNSADLYGYARVSRQSYYYTGNYTKSELREIETDATSRIRLYMSGCKSFDSSSSQPSDINGTITVTYQYIPE